MGICDRAKPGGDGADGQGKTQVAVDNVDRGSDTAGLIDGAIVDFNQKVLGASC